MNERIINTKTVLEESLQLDSLVIEATGAIVAPKDKNVVLTVNGIQKSIVPGTYTGDVKLTVAEGFGRAGGFGPPVIGTDFTAAIRGENGAIVEEKSVLSAVQGGTYSAREITGVSIISDGNEFSGIDLESCNCTLKDINISMNGYGGSDFTGQGVALAIGGTSEVTVDGAKIENRGVIRGGVMVTDDAKVVIRNSEITTYGATADEYLATTAVKKGMLNVPWQLGLTGNCRASNALVRGSVTYENCKINSWGWGVLSSDATDASDEWGKFSVHVAARDSEVSILGSSGYTAFSIGACMDSFENTTFRAADYALIQGDEFASAEYKNCKVYSRRFGTMSYANQGGTVTIQDSSFDTEKAIFLVKGCYPQFKVSNSKLISHSGVILQLIDCDDPTYSPTGKELDSVPPVKVPEHDVTKVNNRDFILFNKLHVEDKPTDVQAHFSDMTLTGDFYNGIANNCPVGSYNPDGKMPFEMEGADSGPELAAGIPGIGAGGPPAGFPEGGFPEGGFPGGGFPDGGFPGGGFPEGGFPEGGFPGGPAPDAAPVGGDPDPGMSEMSFVKSPSTNMPINLAVTLERVVYTGKATAVRSKHAMPIADRDHYDQLGVVTNTPAPVVNNGVIVTLTDGSVWNVTGDCYLSALHIASGAIVKGVKGDVVMTVDGTEVPVASGDYIGDIRLSVKA